MYVKPYDASGVLPISRVNSALPVQAIGETHQELEDRANQFMLGQEYVAKVLNRVDAQTTRVSIGDWVYQMKLGREVSPGQMLTLKVLQQGLHPKFLIEDAATPEPLADTATFSSAAYLIDHYLHHSDPKSKLNSNAAALQQAPTQPSAVPVLTKNPDNPFLMAHDLKHTIENSGLFYESHLADFIAGKYSLNQLLQEPQNQKNFDPSSTVSQQLNIFEHQKLQWAGEAWPGQAMSWTITLNSVMVKARGDEAASPAKMESTPPIETELTLDLPKLGKVKAKLMLEGGHLRVHIEADSPDAVIKLKQSAKSFSEAITLHGNALDQLLIKSAD